MPNGIALLFLILLVVAFVSTFWPGTQVFFNVVVFIILLLMLAGVL